MKLAAGRYSPIASSSWFGDGNGMQGFPSPRLFAALVCFSAPNEVCVRTPVSLYGYHCRFITHDAVAICISSSSPWPLACKCLLHRSAAGSEEKMG
jgi:hypothetical protein